MFKGGIGDTQEIEVTANMLRNEVCASTVCILWANHPLFPHLDNVQYVYDNIVLNFLQQLYILF